MQQSSGVAESEVRGILQFYADASGSNKILIAEGDDVLGKVSADRHWTGASCLQILTGAACLSSAENLDADAHLPLDTAHVTLQSKRPQQC